MIFSLIHFECDGFTPQHVSLESRKISRFLSFYMSVSFYTVLPFLPQSLRIWGPICFNHFVSSLRIHKKMQRFQSDILGNYQRRLPASRVYMPLCRYDGILAYYLPICCLLTGCFQALTTQFSLSSMLSTSLPCFSLLWQNPTETLQLGSYDNFHGKSPLILPQVTSIIFSYFLVGSWSYSRIRLIFLPLNDLSQH